MIGGKKVENRAFYFTDNFSVFCPFSLRISFQKNLQDNGNSKYFLPRIYLKDEIQGRGNLCKSSHDYSLDGERKFWFFSWELVTRTHHVSARMCFGSLRVKLTGQVHGVSYIYRGRTRCTSAFHNAEFVCLVSKLTQSALE